MQKNIFISALLISAIFSGSLQANEVNDGFKAYAIITKHEVTIRGSLSQENRKEVYLIDLKLTPQQKRRILDYHPIKMNNVNLSNESNLPKKVFIGMNGVPVLDQGKYGTCATFANTTAVDVLLGKGDYISQICNLTLGKYLSSKGVFLLSGWWGSSGGKVLDQLLSFGFINKANQKTYSCGGLTDYPPDGSDSPNNSMSLDEFMSMREGLFFPPTAIRWKSLATISDRFSDNPANPLPPYDGNKILMKIKKFLALAAAKAKDNPIGIVTFGVMLPYQICSAGACASYHKSGDTWVLTKAIDNIDPDNDRFKLGAHEMIIMGYDDEAVALDNEGNKHQGLLMLRNSFGEDVGDNGNYYMTYDFFEKFSDEAQVIYQPEFDIS